MKLLRITKAFVLAALLSVFVFSSTQIYANASAELCVEESGGCKNTGCTDTCARQFFSSSASSVSSSARPDACWCIDIMTGASRQ
jgi:hypothetical protein